MTRQSLRKLLVYGIVGLGASLVHILVAWIVTSLVPISIFLANLIGFLVAFLWSYFGHYFLTFQSAQPHRAAFTRFAAVALLGFGVNNGAVLAWARVTGAPSMTAVAFAVFFAAGVVFLAANFWAFRAKSNRANR